MVEYEYERTLLQSLIVTITGWGVHMGDSIGNYPKKEVIQEMLEGFIAPFPTWTMDALVLLDIPCKHVGQNSPTGRPSESG